MSCESFLEAFFRIFNTRGHATKHIWCDNGMNLKAGSKAIMQSLNDVKWKWSSHSIAWRHISLFAPSKAGVIGSEW